jgi:pilus assembly protein TadC
MLIVAVAWIYVVGLMALTEPSFVAGIMTFLFYCVVPLTILFYLTGSRRRKRKRAVLAEANRAEPEARKPGQEPGSE